MGQHVTQRENKGRVLCRRKLGWMKYEVPSIQQRAEAKILLLKCWAFFTKRTENWQLGLKQLVCDLLRSLQGGQRGWIVKRFHSNWSSHLLFKKCICFLCLGFDGLYEPISTLWVSVLIRSYVIRSCQVKKVGSLVDIYYCRLKIVSVRNQNSMKMERKKRADNVTDGRLD